MIHDFRIQIIFDVIRTCGHSFSTRQFQNRLLFLRVYTHLNGRFARYLYVRDTDKCQFPCTKSLLSFQVDALTTERGKEGGWVVERLLNQVS